MEDYKDIRELLRPRRDIKASAKLREKVRLAIDKDRKNRMLKKWWNQSECCSRCSAAHAYSFRNVSQRNSFSGNRSDA